MTQRIAIIGYGTVGRATASILSSAQAELVIIDPSTEAPSNPHADVAIICTPCLEGDIDCIREAAATGAPIVFVRSTVTPAALDALEAALTGAIVISWPEFLTERRALEDVRDPDKVILGTSQPEAAREAFKRIVASEVYLDWLTRGVLVDIVARDAALIAKLAINALYLVKGLLFNTVYDASANDETYREVLKVMRRDHRIRVSHADVWQDGYRGLAGKCLPKDTRILAELSDSEFLTGALVANVALLTTGARVGA